MFGWLKRKLNRLLPDDVNKGFMATNFSNVKLGENLEIPDNVIGFVTYKDKIYLELGSGKHELNRETLVDIYSKQARKSEKLKKLKVDFYFVNKNQLTLDRTFVDKLYYASKPLKSFIDIKLNANVENPKTFYKYVRSEYAFVSSSESNVLVLDYIEDYIRKFFLRKTLHNAQLDDNLILDLTNKLKTSLNSIGLNLYNFEINLSTKEKVINTPENNEFNFFETDKINMMKSSILETMQNDGNINNNENSEQTSEPIDINNEICPKCKAKKIKNSIFCHICGYKF